ncbi:hypothetical protein CW304_08800 [Bacillus sp. UFRGS-B20]|nr:hypothetical protein CW304_08800 [Bacillus sp. UFRGS-B20]
MPNFFLEMRKCLWCKVFFLFANKEVKISIKKIIIFISTINALFWLFSSFVTMFCKIEKEKKSYIRGRIIDAGISYVSKIDSQSPYIYG